LIVLILTLNNAFSQSANFTINNASQCLTGNSFVFTNTSTAGATAYQWTFSDGTTSTATNPTKTYSNYGTYSVQLIATIGGINYYVNKTVEVNAMPVCGFTYYAATGTGNSYSFQSTSSIGSGSMNYSWNFGDGGTATSSNPSHTYLANGTYTVTLTVTSDKGCTCSTTQTVVATVSSGGYSPNLSFSINNNSQCVTGNNFSFTNTTTAISGATYRWNFGDGGTSNAANPTHTYSSAGSYSVSLIATIASVDYTYSQIVNVTNAPTISIAGTACTGSTLTATTNATNISSIQWKNGANVVQTNTPTWNTSYSIVAGNNGAGTNANQLQGAKGIYVDKSGNVYVIDNYQSRVQKWAVGATTGITVAKGLQITGVGVDDAGNVYTVDDINNWVQKWTAGSLIPTTVAGGNGQGSAANQFDNPRGNLYIDASGNIYINDVGNNRIQKWAVAATTGTTVAGMTGFGGPPDSAHLNYVTGVYVDATGTMYINDYSHRVIRWQEGANYGTVIAGTNFFSGGNGASELRFPYAFAFAKNGDLYVSDNGNNRVEKFTFASLANTFTPTTAGTYCVTANSYAGCSSSSCSVVNSIGGVAPSIAITTGVSCGNATICAGSSITFNSSITNGGASPIIQWKVNGSNVATGASFTTSSLNNNDIITAVLTSNAACPNPNPVTSNSIAVAVKVAPTVTITGNACIGSALSLSGSGLSGSTITWSVGGVPTAAAPSIDTNAITVAGGLSSGSGASQLNNQQGIFVDTSNNLYIADFGNDRVQKWANGGVAGVTIAGGNGQGLASNQTNGYGLFVDKNNNLYTVESLHRVQKWAPNATNGITIAGTGFSGNSATQFTLPKSVYIDDCGNMYLADTYNHRVQKFSNGSTVGVTVAGTGASGNSATQLSYPTHVQVDAQGNIYVADNGNSRIQKFAAGSITATTVAGTGVAGIANNKLDNAWGMFVDGGGNIYVADTYNNRIMYWAYGATTGVKIAGTGNYGSGANGLNYPTHVFVGANGNVYVSDSHNNRVQKFAAIAPVSVTPTAPGIYSATVSTPYGCSVTSNQVTVTTCTPSTNPSPSFTINSNSQCLIGNSFVFTNTSIAPSGTTYLWNFGDNTTSTLANPTHIYNTVGEYDVTLIATYNVKTIMPMLNKYM
jgi:PKD repeat protein